MITGKSSRLLRLMQLAAMLALPVSAQATVFGVQLGAVPPATVGPYQMTPFNVSSQNSIADGTVVSQLPAPFGGFLTFAAPATKYSIPATWNTWSNGYTGAVFFNANRATLTMPPNTPAFYFFYEGASADPAEVTVTTSEGATLGPISVAPNGGAIGFAFYSDNAAVTLTSMEIVSADTNGYATAEYGAATNVTPPPPPAHPIQPVPSASPGALALMALMLAMGGAMFLRKRV